MNVYKFTVKFTKLKEMSMNYTIDVYMNEHSMSDAILKIESEFKQDDFEVVDSCKINGRFIK